MNGTDALFAEAVRYHQAGADTEAEALYQQIVVGDSTHADAWHLLGLLNFTHGHDDRALAAVTRALCCRPGQPAYWNTLGEISRAKGDPSAAIRCYRRVLRLAPLAAPVHRNLALALTVVGRQAAAHTAYRNAAILAPEAFEVILDVGVAARLAADPMAVIWGQRALRLRPQAAEAHDAVATAYRVAHQMAAATRHHRLAIALCPDAVASWLNLAMTEQERGAEAASTFRRVLRLDPWLAEGWLGMAWALTDPARAIAAGRQTVLLTPGQAGAYELMALRALGQGDIAQAALSSHRAAILSPGSAAIHYNFALVEQERDDGNRAEALYHRSLCLDPALAPAWHNLGNLLKDRDRPDAAMPIYRRALRLNPDDAKFHVSVAVTQLLAGNMVVGAAELEWLWQTEQVPRRRTRIPNWTGDACPDSTLLIHNDQGLGDAIQLIRLVPRLKERCRRLIIECDDTLLPLFAAVPGIDQVIALDAPLPPVDFQASLLGTMHRLGLDWPDLPGPIPYLQADSNRVMIWRQRLEPGFTAGLVWAGNPKHGNDRRRSCPLAALAPVLSVPGIQWVSLQKGAVAGDLIRLGWQNRIVDLAPLIEDFADTAAIIETLDLVITVDTAVAHLAGALGRPCWVLLPYAPDWRWMRDRSDTPWYPTLRLFRQPVPGDWDALATAVAAALDSLRP
ncbi:MAG: tetratricopeptide repeat protein [Acidobacteriaceae bacterium]|nr:tetratricopeptide repeat protein [Acidobacteriaceae bacterium]